MVGNKVSQVLFESRRHRHGVLEDTRVIVTAKTKLSNIERLPNMDDLSIEINIIQGLIAKHSALSSRLN